MSASITPHQALSVRSPNELLAMSFPESDVYLADGVIAKGQVAAIIGPGGVGKSTLATQLSISLVLGVPFLGMPVGTSDRKCLVLQTENSNRRLSAQFQKQLSIFEEAQTKRIDECLRIHTIEHTGDSSLRLSRSANANAVAKTVHEFAPDVLFVDPLNAFAKGSLSNGDSMLDTLHELQRIATAGNPNATVIVVHHALANNRAFLDAVGPNRGSYGRDSKTLHGWSRGTINLAPGHEAGKIVLACGKNSNGAEFEPIGAKLNTETMLFEIDPSFSLDVWKQAMSGDVGGRRGITPAQVADVVAHRPLKRNDLVAEIMKEFGCGKTKAYDAVTLAEKSTIVMTTASGFRAVKVA